jgi:hypothetical protein
VALRRAHAAVSQPVRDVVEHRQVREQRVRLEDRVDVALVRRQGAHVAAADEDRAVVGLLEAGDQPQRRRLAAARRPEQRQELAVANGEVDAVDGRDRAEALRDPPQLDVQDRAVVRQLPSSWVREAIRRKARASNLCAAMAYPRGAGPPPRRTAPSCGQDGPKTRARRCGACPNAVSS